MLLCKYQPGLGSVNAFTAKMCCEKEPFGQLSNHVLRNQHFRKYLTWEDHLFCENVKNLN